MTEKPLGNSQNTLVDLKKYLSTPERPVSMKEMQEFWGSCSESEKESMRKAELPKS